VDTTEVIGRNFIPDVGFWSQMYSHEMMLHCLTNWTVPLSYKGGMSSAKSAAHERKSAMTPTQRDSVPAKSPVSGGDPVASHSPFDPHHRPVGPGEVYRPHLPPHLDPTLAFHRVLDPGTVFKPSALSTLSTINPNRIIIALILSKLTKAAQAL